MAHYDAHVWLDNDAQTVEMNHFTIWRIRAAAVQLQCTPAMQQQIPTPARKLRSRSDGILVPVDYSQSDCCIRVGACAGNRCCALHKCVAQHTLPSACCSWKGLADPQATLRTNNNIKALISCTIFVVIILCQRTVHVGVPVLVQRIA
jgi:hypothetical protein